MEYDEQKEIVKDLKTAVKFIRIAKTMLDNIKTHVAEENDQSVIIGRLDDYVNTLDTMSEGWDNLLVEEFKTEQLMPGCQLKLF